MTFPEIAEAEMLACYKAEPERLPALFKPDPSEALKYEWIENSPEDVLAMCMDMYDMAEGRPLDPEGLRLQDAFNRLYVKGYTQLNGGGISPRFALRHRQLIEPGTMMKSETTERPATATRGAS